MRARQSGIKRVVFIGLGMGLGPLFIGLSTTAASETVPFNCMILAGNDEASILMTNTLARDASCIVSCKFATTKFNDNPQITCAKSVPAGKEVEMCRLPSGGDKLVKLIEGHAECKK
jgi:hypothetical protein